MNFDALKNFMDRLTSWRIPGNSIVINLGGKEVFSYQSGYEDYENKVPMTSGKLFNIFSCSKPITVTAALQLYEKGFFLLDDPLYDFIPEYKHMFVGSADGSITEAKKPITLRHLFTMTAGFNYNHKSAAFEKARAITDGKMNTLTAIKCLAEEPLSFEPGARWQYSLCHDVLAAVVEVVSGKKFRDYVTDSIFLPLGMNDSFYHNEAVLDRVAKMYTYVNSEETDIVTMQKSATNDIDGKIVDSGKAVPHVYGVEYDSGGAGVTTSVEDYSKFATALANGGVGANGEKIISSGTIDLLRTNQLNEVHMKDYNWPQLVGYGYGLGVRTNMDIAKSGSCGNIGEFGWGGTAGAAALIDPSIGLAMFYTHHMLNPQEAYYQPRLRNVVYSCIR
ncbi:MAG: beta-lactamase family protein [Clostridia bacterium]|nr:beta-lactamase family protein [Clostridia bacterium]